MKKLNFNKCLGCAGKGYVLKLPEKQYKACRLCKGKGE